MTGRGGGPSRSARSARLAAGVLAATLLAAGCGEQHTQTHAASTGESASRAPAFLPETWYAASRELYFGIPVSVTFAPADEALAEQVWAYLEGVDDVFNDYRDDSEIGRINRIANRQQIEISDDLAQAFRLAIEVHKLTGGAFDITTGPLRRLWKEAARSGRLPHEADIAAAAAACGLDQVNLEGNRLTVGSPRVKFDLGGIIKGIAVDRVIAMLKQAGSRAALVQVGGETAAYGLSRRAAGPHVIGVRHPLDEDDIWTAIVDPGTGLSVATSGNYRNPIIIGDRTFYHIFDPKTGRPTSTHTLSVSVAFPETGKNWLADGLATAGAVLGPRKALPLIEKLGAEALMLVREGDTIREHKTPGWDKLVRK